MVQVVHQEIQELVVPSGSSVSGANGFNGTSGSSRVYGGASGSWFIRKSIGAKWF
jgi:hypothetical protein